MRSAACLVLALAAALAGEVVGQGARSGSSRGGSSSRRSSSRRKASCSVRGCRTCTWGSTTMCATCEDGYSLLHGRCEPCSTGCKTCDSAGPGSCDVCAAGFVLVEGGSRPRCEACAEGCASCTCPTDPSCCEACMFGHAFELAPFSYDHAVCSNSDACPGLQRTCQPTWWYLVGAVMAKMLVGLVVLWCALLFLCNFVRAPRGTPSRDSERRHLQYVNQLAQPALLSPSMAGHDGAAAGDALTDAAPYPSGMWRGYYNQQGRNFAVCEFELEFSATGLVRGAGKDTVGAYSIAGRFAGDRVAFTKQYVRGAMLGMFDAPDNLGHAVEYSGRRALAAFPGAHAGAGAAAPAGLGTGILGQWEIEGDRTRDVLPDSGSWHLWPVMDNWQQHNVSQSAHPSAPPPMYRSGHGDDDGGGECCVCFDASINCCLEPCRHIALCMSCAETIQQSQHSVCPLCRAPIVHVHPLG